MPAGSGRTTALEQGAGRTALERLHEQPGGPELLELGAERRDIYLVGGAVRDLLLGSTPRELDVVVLGSDATFAHVAARFAAELAARLGALAGSNEHERFGTAIVEWEGGRVDIAAARRERYPSPGALPQVESASLEQDLGRRDFTVNAIALPLAGSTRGELHAAPDALEDLRARSLRVLHERSFLDDPTRLLRLLRYSVRLGFAVEQHTAELARSAVGERALASVSGARVGAELRLALSEARASEVLEALREWGILAAVHPRLCHDPALAERALGLLPADGRRATLRLAALVLGLTLRAAGSPQTEARALEARALLDRLEFPAGERERAVVAAVVAPRLAEDLTRCERPSDMYALASRLAPEALALAGALAAGPTPQAHGDTGEWPPADAAIAAGRWLNDLRHVQLQITGEDLLAAGIAAGPEVGRRLEAALRARLDGQVAAGRGAELAAALELPWPS